MTTSTYTLKKIKQGPMTKLQLSVIRVKTDVNDIVTNAIDIDNLATVLLTFKGINSNLQIGIRMKKTEQAKKLTVKLNVLCEDFKEQFNCIQEWINTTIKLKTQDSGLSYQTYSSGYGGSNHQDIYLYNFAVNITVQPMALTPVSTMVTTRHYEDTEFTDFQLRAPDGVVPVHKSFLTVHSDMLRTMLRCGEWNETKEGNITIKGVTMKTLQHLKDYMYLGTLPNEIEDLEFLLLIAAFYLMDRMKADCIRKLIAIIKDDDKNDLVEFACENNIPDLMKAVLGI